jgi:DNA repair photolyase
MDVLKNGLSIRSDCYFCPLPFQLDTYWSCENQCSNCFMRRFNRTWGNDLRPLDLTGFEKRLDSGLKNTNPKSALATAIKDRKTVRLGNKTDPYQNTDRKLKTTREALITLLDRGFSVVIQTKFTENVFRDMDLIEAKKGMVTVMPVISPGLDKDWEVFEHKGTTQPSLRIEHCKAFIAKGINVGVNGEPFMPGYHTVEDFSAAIYALKAAGIPSYNTYHLHMNDLVAKNLHEIGVDIEKIWEANRDSVWGTQILPILISIAEDAGVILGSPDFVHSGRYQESSNTCCGITVPHPCTFNMINWKKLYLSGVTDVDDLLRRTWDGVGDYDAGRRLLEGKNKDMFSLKDIEGLEPRAGFLL